MSLTVFMGEWGAGRAVHANNARHAGARGGADPHIPARLPAPKGPTYLHEHSDNKNK